MDSLDIKIEQINKKFKTNTLTSSFINILILGLVFVFFSIGFDLTKKLLTDFINLSWASIFPSVVDLATIAGIILILKNRLNILTKQDFCIHIDKEDIEDTNKVELFLKKHYLTNLENIFFDLIGISCVNFILNIILEGINDQFSPMNEWYFNSSYFTHLPIFPINLTCIVIAMGMVAPIMINYAKYKKEIAQICNIESMQETMMKEVSTCLSYRLWMLVALSIFCIIMSLLQRNDIWIFKYKNPIAQENILTLQTGNDFCSDTYNYTKIHNTEVIVHSVVEHSDYSGNKVNKYFYPVTSELEEKIKLIQKKCPRKNNS